MLDDYRAWLAAELDLLGNATHHAYALGQANMAKRALERLDEALAAAAAAKPPAPLVFVELPVRDVAAGTAFYTTAFGSSFTAFGPTYACTLTGGTDLGLQGDAAEATRAPLAVLAVPDLEAAEAAVTAAGGTITKPTFAFPGGRRFHFTDPSGNELAALGGE